MYNNTRYYFILSFRPDPCRDSAVSLIMQSWINRLGLRLPDVSISAHRESIQLQPPNPTHSLHFLEILCHYRARHRCILRLFAAKYNVYLVIFLKYEDSSMKMCSKWHMCNKYVNLVLILFFFLQTRKSKSETVFEVRTNKLNSLPLTDFYPVDYGLPHQAFGFEVGPVCFKWHARSTNDVFMCSKLLLLLFLRLIIIFAIIVFL